MTKTIKVSARHCFVVVEHLGSSIFRVLIPSYIRDVDVGLLVIDVSLRVSLE